MATLRRYYRAGDTVRLQAANPTFEPIIVDAAAVRITGVVMGVLRRYD